MEIESLKLDFYVDFFPLEFDLGTQFLDIRDASFQHCFETWQLTKFFLYLLLFGKDDREKAEQEWERDPKNFRDLRFFICFDYWLFCG